MILNVCELLKKQISVCSNIKSTKTFNISLEEALTEIKSDTNKDSILKLRNDIENKAKYKESLKAFLFTGTFSKRKTDAIIQYSQLCVLDFDDLSTNECMNSLISYLETCPYVFAYWKSPSGQGIKGLIFFDFSNIPNFLSNLSQYHKQGFKQFNDFFCKTYLGYNIELDPSGKDIPRLCLTSYDPAIKIKDTVEAFEVRPVVLFTKTQQSIKSKKLKAIKDKKIKIQDESLVKNISRPKNNLARRELNSILKFLKKRNLSITENYQSWYKVGQSIANTFSYSIGKDYYLRLCRLDGNKHDEEKSKEKLIQCYVNTFQEVENPLSFETIKYCAREKGWKK